MAVSRRHRRNIPLAESIIRVTCAQWNGRIIWQNSAAVDSSVDSRFTIDRGCVNATIAQVTGWCTTGAARINSWYVLQNSSGFLTCKWGYCDNLRRLLRPGFDVLNWSRHIWHENGGQKHARRRVHASHGWKWDSQGGVCLSRFFLHLLRSSLGRTHVRS